MLFFSHKKPQLMTTKLRGFIHYNVQYVVFVVACIALK
jgi:hypothetical protein